MHPRSARPPTLAISSARTMSSLARLSLSRSTTLFLGFLLRTGFGFGFGFGFRLRFLLRTRFLPRQGLREADHAIRIGRARHRLALLLSCLERAEHLLVELAELERLVDEGVCAVERARHLVELLADAR